MLEWLSALGGLQGYKDSPRVRFQQSLPEEEALGAFRVAEDTPWFVAVLQEIDALEREMIIESRMFVGDTNECLHAIGGGSALEVLRERLVRRREEAVKGEEISDFGNRIAEWKK